MCINRSIVQAVLQDKQPMLASAYTTTLGHAHKHVQADGCTDMRIDLFMGSSKDVLLHSYIDRPVDR